MPLVLTLLFFGLQATAAPSRILKAELVELDEQGRIQNPDRQKQLVRTPSPESPAGFLFEFGENLGASCGQTGCASSYRAMRFVAVGAERDKCRSVEYVAYSAAGPSLLMVLDHTDRVCDDRKDYPWEVTLREPDEPVRRFGGTPVPVNPRGGPALPRP